MHKLSSGMAADIQSMISFRTKFGVTTYENLLNHFDCYCCDKYPTATILTRTMVLEWLAYERTKHKSIRENAIAVRQLGKHIVSEGRTAYILPNNFVLSKSEFVPHIFTDQELSALFEVIDSLKYSWKNPFAHIIAPVLFRLLYTCGLRPNEARELKRADINLESGEILITHNKQKKERIVVMSDDMLDLCNEYEKKRFVFANDSAYYFPAYDGLPYTAIQMTALFRLCWQKANKLIGKDKYPSARPYDLRHRFASAVIQQWINEKRDLYAMLPYLRAYMGHKYFSSTAYYIHLLPENIIKTSGIDWNEFEKLIPEVTE